MSYKSLNFLNFSLKLNFFGDISSLFAQYLFALKPCTFSQTQWLHSLQHKRKGYHADKQTFYAILLIFYLVALAYMFWLWWNINVTPLPFLQYSSIPHLQISGKKLNANTTILTQSLTRLWHKFVIFSLFGQVEIFYKYSGGLKSELGFQMGSKIRKPKHLKSG